MTSNPIPYCGLPPTAAEWTSRWNLDPLVIAALVVAAGAFEYVRWRLPAAHPWQHRHRPGAYRVALALAGVAFVSPLCALAVALFSARAFQHLLLAFVAVPLLVYALPRGVGAAPATTRSSAPVAALAFAAVFCGWHVPGPYEATFSSDAAYWAMHASILAAAAWFWRCALPRGEPGTARDGLGSLAALLVVTMPMGLLAAILTLAPSALYAPHVASTASFGLTALEDQQVGGLLMWVPAGGLLVLVAVRVAVRLATAQAQPTSNPNPSTAP